MPCFSYIQRRMNANVVLKCKVKVKIFCFRQYTVHTLQHLTAQLTLILVTGIILNVCFQWYTCGVCMMALYIEDTTVNSTQRSVNTRSYSSAKGIPSSFHPSFSTFLCFPVTSPPPPFHLPVSVLLVSTPSPLPSRSLSWRVNLRPVDLTPWLFSVTPAASQTWPVAELCYRPTTGVQSQQPWCRELSFIYLNTKHLS